jgi:HD superfamily phosphohydrolase
MLALSLAACAPTMGDFERPKPSVLSDDVLPFAGELASKYRKEPRSQYPFTDQERELRDRAWALLMPQLSQQFFMGWLAEIRRTRILTVEKTVPKRDDYLRELITDDYRSSSGRFARLEMDIQNDRTRYPGFVQTANVVASYDRVRERSLEEVTDASAEERDSTLARIEENRWLVYAVQTSMRERADIYRYTFQRLMMQTPDAAAVGAERALLALERDIGVRGLPEMPAKIAYGK